MSGRTFKGGSKGASVIVWIYVDTSKQVGDRDHLKVFDSQAAAQAWFDRARPGRRGLRIRGKFHDAGTRGLRPVEGNSEALLT